MTPKSAFLVLLFCVTPLFVAFAAPLQDGIDRPGGDFSGFELPQANPLLCQEACARNPQCLAWTYTKPNTIHGPAPRCSLKSAVPAPHSATCCVSGVKAGNAMSAENSPRQPATFNLSGRWRGNDGATYYFRQAGNRLSWYRQMGGARSRGSSVYLGVIEGQRILGRWSDIPHNGAQAGGDLEISIDSPLHLTAIDRTGEFSGSAWTRSTGATTMTGLAPQAPSANAAGGAAASPPAAAGGDAGVALDTLTIPNDRPVKVQSSIVLASGRWYVLEAGGVVSNWDPSGKDGGGVDPIWCYAAWRCNPPEPWNQLRIDDKGLTDIAGGSISYSPKHVYRVRIQGQGKRLVVFAHDAQASWQDNWGAFTLRIFLDVPAPR